MNKVKPLRLEYVVKCSEKGETEVSCVHFEVETLAQKSQVFGIEMDVKLESRAAL